MPRADKPANERERMAVLAQCGVLDTPPEPGFDDLTMLAASMLDVPIALVSLIDSERQYFKSVVGLSVHQSDRDSAFCAHALLCDEPLVIADATLDPRTCDNKLVTGEPHIRFYAGAQLRTSDGFTLGTLCVIDTKPRELSDQHLAILRKLARQAVTQLELRRSHRLASEAMERALALAGEVVAAVGTSRKTAEELREALAVIATERERLALALSSGGLGAWDWNVQTGELHFDARWLEIIGETTIRPHIDDCNSRVHQDDLPKLMAAAERHFAGETPVCECTHRLRHRDGSYRWVSNRGVVVARDVDGKPLRMVGTHADVTEKVRAAETARAADEMLRRTGTLAKVGGWEVDVQSQWATWSEEVYRIHEVEFGTPMTVEIAIAFYEPKVRETIAEAVRVATETGQGWDIELPLVTAKGRSIWVRAQGEAVRRDGKAVTLRGAFQDVTEQTRARQWLKSLVNNLPGVAFRVGCDAKWTNLFVSDAIETLTGYPASDFINNAVRDCASITHPGDADLVKRAVTAAVTDRESYSIEYRIIHKSGEVRWVNERGQVVFDGGTARYLDGVMFDISPQKAAEQALIEARATADAASRSKSEFLAYMSHEIRTPLTAILGYADLLATDEDVQRSAENRGEILGTIRHAGEHLLTVVNDILDISKIEASKMVVESVDTDLGELLRGVESLLTARAAEKGLKFELCLSTPVPGVVRTDPTRVRQVLMNLVGNAIKFTDHGSVRIEISGRELGENFELRMAVLDTGPGLSEAQASRLFAAFVQADSTVTRRHGGTGLGLAICQRLARMMGGDVVLTRSAPSEGSEFVATFTVGQAPGNAMLTDLRQHAAESLPAAVNRPASLRGRVLLAEDGIDNQRLIALYLTKAGAQVDIAENGRIALELIDVAAKGGWAYDLLLTDMQMPEIDGYTLATMLRARGCKLPIIALTAHAMAADRNKCMEAGCDDYASKPIDRRVLLETCGQWMGRQGGTSSRPRTQRSDEADGQLAGIACSS